MNISPINFTSNNKKRPLINTNSTGYLAAGGLGLTVASGITKNKSFRKAHKGFSMFTGAMVLLHIFLIETNKMRYRHAMKNQ